MQDQDNKEDLD